MTAPLLSIVVVVHDMSTQARNTLLSLSPEYQSGVAADDYEVVIVESSRSDPLGEAAVKELPGNFRYLRYENPTRSPVNSVAEGVSRARGDLLAVAIDGARLLTPRVLHYTLAAFRLDPHAMVTVPGYHLGSTEQHEEVIVDQERDQRLLRRAGWPEDPYRVFTVSVPFRGRHQPGYLRPALESNFLAVARCDYEEVGGIDLAFDLPGGGMANLDLYRRVGELPQTRLFVLPGEGTFHQYHGGVTTKFDPDREKTMEAFKEQYLDLRGSPYRRVEKEVTVLGPVTGWALPNLRASAEAEMADLA